MQIIRSGVDSIYLAIKGTLPAEVLSAIAAAKAQAMKERRPVFNKFGDGKIIFPVKPHGAPGGYAFTWDTGPLGAIWLCREAADRPDWNLFVKPHASALLAHGFGDTMRSILAFLPALGGNVIEYAVNRIDYAMDIRADDFTLELDNFVSHWQTKRTPHWKAAADTEAAAVFTGRRLETVTVGKMPGRQLTIYDKTAQARAKRALYWFDAWGLDPTNRDGRVWRLELRLGKRELKDRRKITTLADLDGALRPALTDLLASIRYLAPGQADPNISRRKPHQMWFLANDHIRSADLLGGVGEITPDRIIEITEEQKQEIHRALVVGNAAALAAAMDLDDATIQARLPGIAAQAIEAAIGRDQFQRTLERARARRRKFGSSDSQSANA